MWGPPTPSLAVTRGSAVQPLVRTPRDLERIAIVNVSPERIFAGERDADLQGCPGLGALGGIPQAKRHRERAEKPWRTERLAVRGQRTRAVRARSWLGLCRPTCARCATSGVWRTRHG